jgi:hypothetical protein
MSIEIVMALDACLSQMKHRVPKLYLLFAYVLLLDVSIGGLNACWNALSTIVEFEGYLYLP